MSRAAFARAYGRRVDAQGVELRLGLKSFNTPADFRLEKRLPVSDAGGGGRWRQQWLAHAVKANVLAFHENPVFEQGREHVAPAASRRKGAQFLATVVSHDAPLEARLELALEARLLTLLERHPNVLTLVALVSDGGPAILVTEYPEGGRLRHYLRMHGASLSVENIEAGCVGLASAMAYLESLAIVHRALSLDCVAVGRDLRELKLMEFGEVVLRMGPGAA
jgi:serine/threonine protein kinase